MWRVLAGKVVSTAIGVKIVGYLNVPGLVAPSASLLDAGGQRRFIIRSDGDLCCVDLCSTRTRQTRRSDTPSSPTTCPHTGTTMRGA